MDVVRCDLCDTPNPQLYCNSCRTNLCMKCVGDHTLDSSTQHQVEAFKDRRSTPNYPICSDHVNELCKGYCEQCDVPVCIHCLIKPCHQTHKKVEILSITERKKKDLQRDLEELEKSIFPKYTGIENNISIQEADFNKNSQKLTSAIDKHGKELHQKIDTIIKKLKSDLDKMNSKHMAVLNKQKDKITPTLSEIKRSITELKKLLDSNDVSNIFAYKSRNAEFRKLPPKLKVSPSNFTPQKINTEQLYQQFGSLSACSITTEEHSCTNKTSETGSSPLKPMLDEPRIISTIQTKYEYLRNVSCHSDENIWMRGYGANLEFLNLQGEQLRSIRTKSGNVPRDIAVTRSGDLVYSDSDDKTVNIVKNTPIQTVIRLQEWKPVNVCSTSSGGLLVVMVSDDKPTKVVRYSGSTEKQSIQYNDKGQPLYSSGRIKYISENRNLDICVSDHDARAVVVVNQAGKLRFIYTGHSSFGKISFDPVGISTDSLSRILTADCDNDCIHIVGHDGQFLRYIENCQLQRPWGLSIDTKDNLFVTEYTTCKMKKIQYYK